MNVSCSGLHQSRHGEIQNGGEREKLVWEMEKAKSRWGGSRHFSTRFIACARVVIFPSLLCDSLEQPKMTSSVYRT